jgi:hypothetical protein
MTEKKPQPQPITEGYQPVQKGYQPTSTPKPVTTGDKVQGGYQPDTGQAKPTVKPPPKKP